MVDVDHLKELMVDVDCSKGLADFCMVQTLALVAFCRPSMVFCMVQTLALASETH